MATCCVDQFCTLPSSVMPTTPTRGTCLSCGQAREDWEEQAITQLQRTIRIINGQIAAIELALRIGGHSAAVS